MHKKQRFPKTYNMLISDAGMDYFYTFEVVYWILSTVRNYVPDFAIA